MSQVTPLATDLITWTSSIGRAAWPGCHWHSMPKCGGMPKPKTRCLFVDYLLTTVIYCPKQRSYPENGKTYIKKFWWEQARKMKNFNLPKTEFWHTCIFKAKTYPGLSDWDRQRLMGKGKWKFPQIFYVYIAYIAYGWNEILHKWRSN